MNKDNHQPYLIGIMKGSLNGGPPCGSQEFPPISNGNFISTASLILDETVMTWLRENQANRWEQFRSVSPLDDCLRQQGHEL